ncbi:PIN-like domain-containing protein [Microbacterium mangrovi]|uniref:PIN-like domain-containing protein n=1 Tax=Microbacterium mangrovi TaxID=1348253 RepID=UPI0012E04C7A|nr:hypothetical protein [Microbacterium mangrovi]
MYFADENALGLGKLLERTGRTDVVYPGHPSLPEVPLGCPDLDWMPVVALQGLIVLTRDRRIRTRPAELEIYLAQGIRAVWLGGKRDLGPRDQLALFIKHEERLQRQAVKLGGGPWALIMTATGVRELSLRSLD